MGDSTKTYFVEFINEHQQELKQGEKDPNSYTKHPKRHPQRSKKAPKTFKNPVLFFQNLPPYMTSFMNVPSLTK